jgi:hypothetical protein
VISIDQDRKRATVELPLEVVEFIGAELPSGDGFTQDWWKHVWKPLLEDEEI